LKLFSCNCNIRHTWQQSRSWYLNQSWQKRTGRRVAGGLGWGLGR